MPNNIILSPITIIIINYNIWIIHCQNKLNLQYTCVAFVYIDLGVNLSISILLILTPGKRFYNSIKIQFLHIYIYICVCVHMRL